MTKIPTSKTNILVIVDGVTQGIDAYNVSSTTLTLTETATDVVVVKHLGVPYVIATIPSNSVGEAELQNSSINESKLQVNALQVSGLLPTAWCTFDGTLVGTNAPIAGYNVVNVTRNSSGSYTVNFNSSLDVANYSVSISPETVNGRIVSHGVKTVTQCDVYSFTNGGVLNDSGLDVIIFGGRT